jgi:hypothetical protein
VAHRGPLRIVLALRPARLGDLGLKHRRRHRQPSGVGRVSEANSGYVFMAVPYSFFVVYLAVHPKTYHQAGLR